MDEKSELTIITKAKELCNYIMTITHKSPKEFRFSFVSRLQNLSLNIIEYLYKANDLDLRIENEKNKRLEYQKQAGTEIRLLSYFSEIASSHNCILFKQYEHISLLTTECLRYLSAWITSDNRRNS